MDRPLASSSSSSAIHDRHTSTAPNFSRPRNGHDTRVCTNLTEVEKMSSCAEPVVEPEDDRCNFTPRGPFDSFGYNAELALSAQSRTGTSQTLSSAGCRPSEAKTLGKPATKRARFSALFSPRHKETAAAAAGHQEEKPHHNRQTQAANWLRRARSTTLRIGRKPTQEKDEAHGLQLHGMRNASDPPVREQSPDSASLRPGAAARAAAAAASRERLEPSARSTVSKDLAKLKDLDLDRDSESGIGIVLKDDASADVSVEERPLPRLDPACLPPEIFEHIIHYLDAESVMWAELVSKKWRETTGSYRVWRSVFGSEFRRRGSITRELPVHVGGLGLGVKEPVQDWKQMWKVRKALDARWQDGYAAAIYLEGHSDSVYCVQFDEDKIITGSRDRTIRVWDSRTYRCIKVLGIPKSQQANINPTPIGSRMNRQRPFLSYHPPKSERENEAQPRSMNHHGSVLCLQFDSEIMVTGSSDTSLIVWDIAADYEPLHRLECHTAGVLDVCFDAQHIASCSKDTTICLWERSTGTLLRTLNGHRGPVNAVQLRGTHIVSASGDGIAKLWSLTTGNCVKEFPSRDRGLACVEFSPDSRTILAGGNDQVIYQFDANTGELVRELSGHAGLVRSLHLDGINGRVVSGSYDYSVKAFDVDSGRMLCDFAGWTTSWMLSAKADYRRIVATSQDGRAVIMDFGFGLKDIKLLEGR